MKLSLDQIRAIAKGVVRVDEEPDGGVRFYRFTEAQSQTYYETGNMNFYDKTYASAGVRLAFVSTTEHLSFRFKPYSGSSRKWFSFDVRVNDRIAAHAEYNREDDPSTFHFEAELKAGEKKIELYMPFSARVDLYDLSIDDGATLAPLHRKHTMIEFGDSITHGYDGHYPSLSYANRLAFLLDADSINKGIGGDTFFPELLGTGGDLYDAPDYITVAYGVNDWHLFDRAYIEEKCRAFYLALTKRYPKAKIFAITPIWCGDAERPTAKFGAPLREMDRLVRDCTADFATVTVICGDTLVPHSPDFFAEDCLHPNDLGFSFYGPNLYEEIKKHLK